MGHRDRRLRDRVFRDGGLRDRRFRHMVLRDRAQRQSCSLHVFVC